MSSRFYGSFEDFARDEIRPTAARVGWSLDDLDFDSELPTEDFSFKETDEDEDEE